MVTHSILNILDEGFSVACGVGVGEKDAEGGVRGEVSHHTLTETQDCACREGRGIGGIWKWGWRGGEGEGGGFMSDVGIVHAGIREQYRVFFNGYCNKFEHFKVFLQEPGLVWCCTLICFNVLEEFKIKGKWTELADQAN